MLDWLAIWGVSSVVGFVFKDVLLPLAKDSLEDYCKDFFKDCIKDFSGLFEKDALQKVVGKALKEFLALVQQELEDADLSEAELKKYINPLRQFIQDQSVKAILGSAFNYGCDSLDATGLAKSWYRLDLPPLPEEFNWQRVGKRYLKKVKALIRESDELRTILDSQNLAATAQYSKELAGIVAEFKLESYQEGLRERYSNLNLDSLDASVYNYREKLKVWQVFIAQNVRECRKFLPQVYEMPKEHQLRMRESGQLETEFEPEAWERYKEVYYQQPICSVLEIVNDSQTYPYLVILGDPGSGKSMLLQYLALNWARSPLNNVIELPIPLLIELRIYNRDRNSGKCQDFLEFFHNGNVICRLNQHKLQERLKAGKVVVLFDGLDEVFDPVQREEVITDIHRFTNEYPQVRVIITSRVIGYKARRLSDAQFRHFLLQDLEAEQIKDFIQRWHQLTFTDEEDKQIKQERLQKAIDTSKAIKELAGNPLLLTMMAVLNRNQELPRDRPELYNQASKVLLHQWDVERKLLKYPRIDAVTIDYRDKQAILRQIAYHMQAADKGLAGNLIQGKDLEQILTRYLKSIEVSQARTVARLLIEQLRSRNFILCFLGGDTYGFVHRTFLEYFCASEFVERFGKRGLEGGLTLEELKTEVFGKHWSDQSWHEVLRLISGMIETKFAGEVIEYLMSQSGEEERFVNVFLAAECLDEVRNQHEIRQSVEELLNCLKGLLKFGDFEAAIEAENLDEGFQILEIRQKSVAAIATTWHDDLDTLPWLKQKAQSDQDKSVRYVAVQAIARGWKDDPDTLPWLKEKVDSDQDKSVRSAVVREIASGWKGDPGTLPWLKQIVDSDQHEYVRRAAVREIASGWHDDPDTLPLLKQMVDSDQDGLVRSAAVEAIASGWKDEPWLFELLHHVALNDPFEQKDREDNPRKTALDIIIEQYPNHPQTLPLLQDRAENDPDEQVREFAQKRLDER